MKLNNKLKMESMKIKEVKGMCSDFLGNAIPLPNHPAKEGVSTSSFEIQ